MQEIQTQQSFTSGQTYQNNDVSWFENTLATKLATFSALRKHNHSANNRRTPDPAAQPTQESKLSKKSGYAGLWAWFLDILPAQP